VVLLVLGSARLVVAGDVAFVTRPTASAEKDGVHISFSVNKPTDVEVAVLDAKGKVVRHLAAGVLGAENPPPPPLKPGLAQELLWDGKDDLGKKAEGGRFKVRVRAGMSVRFGRLIGDSPYNFSETVCRGLAVDPRTGDLYFMGNKDKDAALYFLRVYDRTGKYLRELMPYPVNLDARRREAFGSMSVPGLESPAPMNYFSLWPLFYPVNPGAEDRNELAFKLMALHPTEESVVLIAEKFHAIYRIRKSDGGALHSTFAEPLWEEGTGLARYDAVGPVMGAASPDGKVFYFAGYAGKPREGQTIHPAWPNGRVYRMAAGGTAETFVDVPLPEDAPPPKPSWNVLGNVQALHGITVDKQGRVFVCDAAGGKVWVFSPDGKVVGSVSVPDAYMCVLDEKAGSLYVLTRRELGYRIWAKSLVKLSGWGANTEELAALKFPERGGATDPFLAGDFTGPVPQLWVSGCPRQESLLRIEDRNDKLEVVEDLEERAKAAAGFACRLDVDPEADLVYVHNGWAHILRYDGLTGNYAGPLDKDGQPQPLIGSEFCIRRDGMIYLSGRANPGGGYSGPFRRLGRDLTPAPLPDGRTEFTDRYGKMGGGYFGNQGSCVTPDGHLYFNGMITFRVNAVFEVNPDGTAGRGPRLREVFATDQVTPAIKKGGFEGALVGWLQDQSGGLDVDNQGNIYVGIRILPREHQLPGDLVEELAGGGTRSSLSLGSVVKFRPSGGGMVPDNLEPGQAYKVSKHWPVEFTVPQKLAAGIKMAPGQRLDWYSAPWTIHMEGGLKAYPVLAPFSSSCACQTPRFDVDDYGRLYIPNALACTVRVVDNEGNEIVRFGGYGNHDSQGPESAIPKPGIPLAYPVAAKSSFKHIYVADSANRRVLRVDPVYAAEEVCEVR
jgi:hypothetical protein